MLISRTPPSQVLGKVLASNAQLFLKVTWAPLVAITTEGESIRLSLTTLGSSTKALLGAVSGVVVDVTQSGTGPTAFEATHPAGNAGATTESKFSEKRGVEGPIIATEAEAQCAQLPILAPVTHTVLVRVLPQSA